MRGARNGNNGLPKTLPNTRQGPINNACFTFQPKKRAVGRRAFLPCQTGEGATSDIYTDAQLEKLCDALAARLAKAARNGIESIH